MKKVFSRSKLLKDVPTHYCPGCGHGIVHRLIAEVIEELGIREKTIGIAPVGCAVIAYDYWDFDVCEAAHGRTPAVATGIKRVLPDRIVFTYQGDGDLAAIGTSEILHTANRGENISVVFVNNGVYGMTGGQMAPTTLINQRTATTYSGRNPKLDGYPLNITDLLKYLNGAYYLERCSVHSPKEVLKTKQAIKKVLQNQIEGRGFSLVEVLSMCPTYWNMSTQQAVDWIGANVVKQYPLGIIKNGDQA
ncbi:MAG: 2-oxoglutarate oxidoreductase [Candidatus Omnitrophica bacterium CG07_land_8_20_14_0_80_42_15]|uniref:2-oxoglutarate oxidoreductase n=1 Tax=Candidatus Aquitaenariimonas noxiae TaxID=1974741 RepID=A0A2J0KYE2_9BACT|nr:MAG: 2-oxoglutarate oxidoreductase [Candidatus Omnitrophica bacterium CG07_land_8_20_14_0_80_42_15]